MKFAARRSLWQGTGSCSGPASAASIRAARRERPLVGLGHGRAAAPPRSRRRSRRCGRSRSSMRQRLARSRGARAAPPPPRRAVAGSRSSSAVIRSPSTNSVTRQGGSSSIADDPGRDPGLGRALVRRPAPPRGRSRAASVSLPGTRITYVGAAEARPVVAVGDPAVERRPARLPARPSARTRARCDDPSADRSSEALDAVSAVTGLGSRASIGRVRHTFYRTEWCRLNEGRDAWKSKVVRPGRRRTATRRARLQTGAEPGLERVLQLRDLVHDHLDPRRLLHHLRAGVEQRRPDRDLAGAGR